MAAYGAGGQPRHPPLQRHALLPPPGAGVIGAALDSGATVELICDGLHIHPAVIRATHKLFGDKLVIISDSCAAPACPTASMSWAGSPSR